MTTLDPWAKLFAVKYWREGKSVASITLMLEREIGLAYLEAEVWTYLAEAQFIKRY